MKMSSAQKLTLILVPVICMIAACTTAKTETKQIDQKLVVWGAKSDVDRFVKLETSQDGAWHKLPVRNQTLTASATIAPNHLVKSGDIVLIAREALLAHLSYRFEQVSLTSSPRV